MVFLLDFKYVVFVEENEEEDDENRSKRRYIYIKMR